MIFHVVSRFCTDCLSVYVGDIAQEFVLHQAKSYHVLINRLSDKSWLTLYVNVYGDIVHVHPLALKWTV